MKRIENDPIPTGLGTDEKLFRDYAGVHLSASGFPGKRRQTCTLPGHRIGFPGTKSNMAFYDLEDLKNGDKVYLEDAEGREYTYEVYEKLVVEPTNLTVINADPGQEHHQPADLHASRLHQARHLQGRAQGHQDGIHGEPWQGATHPQ